MPKMHGQPRFARAAFARRLLHMVDECRRVRNDVKLELLTTTSAGRAQLLTERQEMMENLELLLDQILRTLPYWR